MARGVRRSWVPTFCLTCCVPRDTIFLPLSDPQFPHLGGNVIKAHSVLQTGAVMCCGHTSVQPTVAKGKKTTREDSGQWHKAWPAESLGCFQPISQANTKPQLLFDLASCTLFSLQSKLLILLSLSQAISMDIIPGGLLLSLGIQGRPQREPSS